MEALEAAEAYVPPIEITNKMNQSRSIRYGFQVGEMVDYCCGGAWFEAIIVHICERNDAHEINTYQLFLRNFMHHSPAVITASWTDVRPRSYRRYFYYWELKPEMIVLVNYNIENPGELGLWYDFYITKVYTTALEGVLFGKDVIPNFRVTFKEGRPMKIENEIDKNTPFSLRDTIHISDDNYFVCNSKTTNPDFFGTLNCPRGGERWLYLLDFCDIHGSFDNVFAKEEKGVYSIILDGTNLEAENDNGESFIYIVCDDDSVHEELPTKDEDVDRLMFTLKLNRLLYLNVMDPETKRPIPVSDWRDRKPIRIFRSYTCGSKYAPENGYRYDGTYKIKWCRPEIQGLGRLVWRYYFVRDDPDYATWILDESDLADRPTYLIDPYALRCISQDKVHAPYWKFIMRGAVFKGKETFFDRLIRAFTCFKCRNIVYEPITPDCKHTLCKVCFLNSMDEDTFTCCFCRIELVYMRTPKVNLNLWEALKTIFLYA